MKKKMTAALGLTMATAMLLTLGACSPQTPAKNTDPKPAATNTATTSGTDQKGKNTNQTKMPLFGKVSNAVGNELTLELANPPEGFDPAQMPRRPAGDQGNPGAAPAGDDGGVLVQAAPGDSGKDNEGEPKMGYVDEDGSMHDSAQEKIQLDYTGTSQDVTIPAGVPIMNLLGKTLKLNDLKPGSVLMITFDDKGNIDFVKVMG